MSRPFPLDEYCILGHLGSGEYGTVQCAQGADGRLVAIKTVSFVGMRASQVQRARNEARIHSQMMHPNIARVEATIATDDAVHIVMECAEGGDLLQLLTKGKLCQEMARLLFYEICCAVEYMHASGYMHRDLKLENVLLSATGEVKLADFGFAGQWRPLELHNDSFGSISYAAPEIVGHTSYTGPEVDCWSLGVILFAMLTESFPFGGANETETAERIMSGVYAIPAYVSAPCAHLIAALLEVDSRRRFTVREALQHPWLAPFAAADQLFSMHCQAPHHRAESRSSLKL